MLLELLQSQSGLTIQQLNHYALTASKRYRVYEIEKKNGGTRKIEHPSKAIKSLQRWIVKNLILRLPVHHAATAYLKGASIKKNAIKHIGTKFTLRMDFESFFPSFSSENVKEYLQSKKNSLLTEISDDDISFVVKLVSRNGALTIGAPSSPMLTNVMMYDFDYKLSAICECENLVYTRYADDIFISSFFPSRLEKIIDNVRTLCGEFLYGNLKINENKTKFLSRKYRRSIAGVVITPDNNLSIGREKKDFIKKMIYMHSNGRLDIEERLSLCGMVAYIRDIEPVFYQTLIRKYGEDVILSLRS